MDITAVIKTFKRPECCLRLVNSIRYFYPNIPIIVVDDDKPTIACNGARIISAPFNCGPAIGRNIGVRNASTKYVLILDDDFVFNEKTKIEILLDVLEQNPNISICAGRVINGRQNEFTISIIDHKLYAHPVPKSRHHGFDMYDVTEHFFVARRDDILDHLWDENLLIAGPEHTDFFLGIKNAGLQVAFCPDVEVLDLPSPVPTTDYDKYRYDKTTLKDHNEYLMKKHDTTSWFFELNGRLCRAR